MKPHEHKEEILYAVADSQLGYFTARQAMQAGYSRRLQRHHVSSGDWERALSGIYRLTTYPDDRDEQLAWISLWNHDGNNVPQAVLSHETALEAHGISDVMPEKIHVTLADDIRKRPLRELRVHRSRNRLSPDSGDVERRGAYLVTNISRTLLDVANESLISPEHLANAIDDAIKEKLISSTTVYELLDRCKDDWRREVGREAVSRLESDAAERGSNERIRW